MANRTDKEAASIHGTNPQNLIEYISRQKIYDSLYWKQECFGLSAERLVDKAVELKYVCGMFGEPQKASEFICLILKMLQIQPDKDIVVEFIKNDDFKYLRLLGAFYMRLVGRAADVYQYLEPLYNDYRKVRVRRPDGNFELNHIDEVVDAMLRKDYLFNIALPRLPARSVLEKAGQLEPRVSVLDEEFDEAALEEEREEAAKAAAALERELAVSGPPENGEEEGERKRRRSPSPWRLRKDEKRPRAKSRSRTRSRSRERRRERSRSRGRERRERSGSRERRRRDRSRSDERRRRRSRSRSGDRRREDRERDRGRDRDREQRERRRSRSGDRGRRRGGREEGELDEIAEANALRAKLGLRPLK